MANARESDRSNLDAALFRLTLDRAGAQPLHLQLTEALRGLILGGRHGGCRLPPTRLLAQELSVSRMTVTSAYDQLIAEGYLTARRGDGTYVARDLTAPAPPPPKRIAAPPLAPPILPFQPGLPDQALFPHRLWARHLERAWRRPAPDLLNRPDSFGWHGLRQTIADHLAVWRGLDCAPDQILVTAGAWDAFDILCRALLPPGARVAIEDPGWPVLHELLHRAGARPLPLRIDEEGLDPKAIPSGVRAAIVTPSRHYPTGTAMPLARRLALLAWAREARALVIEDDYDSEFRYQGQPLPALAGIDGLRTTIYAGSFSKLLSPTLRIGYLVLPEALVGRVRDHLAIVGARASLLPQPPLAGFMASGEFAAHLRRMRRIHATRQALLLAELSPVAHLLELRAEPSGMHLLAPLAPRLRAVTTDRALAARAAEAGLTLRALSAHARLPDPPQGLVLGYTAFDEATLRAAARRLCALLAGQDQ